MPRSIALERCVVDAGKLSESSKAWCQSESAAVELLRAGRIQTEREAEALRQSREASGR
jgi:hypothetical protein